MKPVFTRQESRIPFTRQGYQKVLDEYAELLARRPEAVEHLRKAREMGDLSENGYYKASRAELSFLDARLRRLERLKKLGKVVESASDGRVDIGSHVTISDGQKEYEYTIVGGYESDPSKHNISHISPIGKALLGRRRGESVQVSAPRGIITYTIREIS
jgi:transcription elongation factor GreA